MYSGSHTDTCSQAQVHHVCTHTRVHTHTNTHTGQHITPSFILYERFLHPLIDVMHTCSFTLKPTLCCRSPRVCKHIPSRAPPSTHIPTCTITTLRLWRGQCSLAPTDTHVCAHPHGGAHTMLPISPPTLMLRLRPLPQPHACSLVDEPVTDLTGQEDVRMEPQSLLVQQVAQGAIQVAQAEVGAEGHQGLRGV